MYFEEKVVNGVLCRRSTPDGEWVPFTAEALTTAFVSMRSIADDRRKQVDDLMDMGLAAKKALSA